MVWQIQILSSLIRSTYSYIIYTEDQPIRENMTSFAVKRDIFRSFFLDLDDGSRMDISAVPTDPVPMDLVPVDHAPIDLIPIDPATTDLGETFKPAPAYASYEAAFHKE